jgi:tripartite-type tricarboxylate transporter receptor subunit TctC
MKKTLTTLFAALIAMMQAGAAYAAYPEKPIRIIVPFAPGGIADTTARVIAADLSTRFRQPVLVDNRPGGAAIIGAGLVAKSPADGYTLLMASTNISTNPSLYKKLPYDADKDLIPVALNMTIPGAVIVNPALPVKTFSELVSYAKAHPGKINYSSVGQGSFPHLSVEMLSQRSAINMVHVPYKGYSPAITAVLSGEADLLASDLPGALPFIQSGKLQVLAITGSRRVAMLPDVPTIEEQGVKDYEAVGWLGIMAPAGTPANIVSLLNAEINKAMRKPAVTKRFSDQGVDIVVGDPATFKQFLNRNKAGWEKVIKAANISLDQ